MVSGSRTLAQWTGISVKLRKKNIGPRVINQLDIGAVFVFKLILQSGDLLVSVGLVEVGRLHRFLEFDGERLTYLSYRTGLSHVLVAASDLANCDLPADIGPPSVGWWRGLVPNCNE